MKNIILILLLSSVSFAFGQNFTKKGDLLFDQMRFKEAASLYEKALSKKGNEDEEASLLKKVADSYFFDRDMKNAHKFYDELIINHSSEIDKESIFRYSHSLLGIGKSKEAKRWMEEYELRKNNKKLVSKESILAAKPNFVLKNLAINTKHSDFGAMYYKNDLIYSSAKKSNNFRTRINGLNDQPFLNMYRGNLNKLEDNVKFLDEFSKDLSTKYDEASLAFSPDEKVVYFTRSKYNGDSEEDGSSVKLYSAHLTVKRGTKNGNWLGIKELPFNSEYYSVGQPAVSKDGKLLYFVSDMPGSIGLTDIYVVDIHGNGTYSEPRNLGDVINTPGKEMFPFVSEERLYFASDGHIGFGGLDVFYSNIEADNFDIPRNLGMPLNSESDDFGFIIKESKKTGFVCSDREGGKGSDDIYSFRQFGTLESIENNIVEKD